MSTTQTVLIVGGAAVGAFLLFKALQPSTPVVSKAKAGTDVLSLNSIVGLGTSLAGLFKPSTSVPNDGTYHADTSGFEVSGNTLVDSGGNELVYGTGY